MTSLKLRRGRKFRIPAGRRASPAAFSSEASAHREPMYKRILLVAALAIPAAASAQFQAGRLPAASRDSFDVMIQGRPFGTYIMSHSRTGDNFTLVTTGTL